MQTILSVVLASLLSSSLAQFNFSNTHGDHMVLQQGPNLSIVWGFGSPGAAVTVSLEPSVGAPASCVVSNESIWSCSFGPVAASDQAYIITASSEGQTAVLNDVLFGDVWLCSGQSNMQFTVDSAFNATAEVAAAANFPLIRLFSAALYASNTPLTELQSVMQPWSVAGPTAVGGGNWTYFSANCWFYGRDIFESLQYPIGLIDTDWGGTPDEAWSSPDALAKCPHLPAPPNDVDTETVKVGAEPSPDADSVLWNAMIVPFLRAPIYGVIWYQGEADAVAPNDVEYACTFPAMIADWRAKWNEFTNGISDSFFPFGFVMLSTYEDTTNVTCGNNPVDACPWAIVRWGQTGGYGYVPNPIMPNTFMSIAVDWGDPSSPWGDVHPRYKQPVAARLANAGLAVAYQQSERYWTGPIAQQATTNGSIITITFAATGSAGLYIKNENYVHFEVGTANSIWTAVPIAGWTTNTVSLAFEGDALQVRYNWYTAPCEPAVGPLLCAVYAKAEQLPAAPFFLNVTLPAL